MIRDPYLGSDIRVQNAVRRRHAKGSSSGTCLLPNDNGRMSPFDFPPSVASHQKPPPANHALLIATRFYRVRDTLPVLSNASPDFIRPPHYPAHPERERSDGLLRNCRSTVEYGNFLGSRWDEPPTRWLWLIRPQREVLEQRLREGGISSFVLSFVPRRCKLARIPSSNNWRNPLLTCIPLIISLLIRTISPGCTCSASRILPNRDFSVFRLDPFISRKSE